MECQHQNFNAFCEVNRIFKDESNPGDIVAYTMDVRAACRECGQEFAFFGVPNGMSFYQPTMSIDGKRICLPMVIPGTEPPKGLAGFKVTYHVFEEKEAVTN